MESPILILVVLLPGAALGAAVAWFLLKTRASSASAADVATLKERLAGKESEIQRLQDAFSAERGEHKLSRGDNAQLRAELEGERRAAQERKEAFKQAADEL